MRLLCACCRVKPNDADLKLQAALASQISADKLTSLAVRHRVEPLLYHNLKQHAAGVFSAAMLDALAERTRQNAVKSLQALRINVQLARLLRDHAIPYLPLKGVTLAQRYYGSVSLRHANDIDFWVPLQSVDAVRALLAEQGCHPDDDHDHDNIVGRGERHRRFLRRYFHHDTWVHSEGERLELHWRLTSNAKGLKLDPLDLLACGDRVDVAANSMGMIGPVPLLLYLCEHGARHGWYRLKWLMDLPQVLESREWDWPQVFAEARRANCFSALLLGLRLSQMLFGWVVSEPVAVAMQKHRLLDWQVRMVCRNLDKPESAIVQPTILQRCAHLLYRTSLIESFGFVWNQLNHYSLSHHVLKLVRLPDSLFWAYYALHPLLVWVELFRHRWVRQAK